MKMIPEMIVIIVFMNTRMYLANNVISFSQDLYDTHVISGYKDSCYFTGERKIKLFLYLYHTIDCKDLFSNYKPSK